MKVLAFLLSLTSLLAAAPAPPDVVWTIWGDQAPPGNFTPPGPEKTTLPEPGHGAPFTLLTNVQNPRLEVFLPKKKNGAAVIIVPGGGFGILACEHEGSELATWFRERGFVAAVLEHRCPTNQLPKPWEFPAQDTQRAMSYLRSKADELGIKSDRIGLFGFSAGGQVALIAATNDEARLYPTRDAVDGVGCRPDFLGLAYPWKILAEQTVKELKPEIHLGPKTAPTFIIQANDDPHSLAEGSVLTFLALRQAKVAVELHIYETGGHGFGLRPVAAPGPGDWTGRMEGWLKARGLLGSP